jgi:hypothetical protein
MREHSLRQTAQIVRMIHKKASLFAKDTFIIQFLVENVN